ncbi:MAG: IS200/IS605 family element transposase accessory protein TnpB [Chloroflexi bacterium]|nr:MAG: IS200/IS605 family element transposase accessory protein TnpB [Chloroflexota bacterium]
MGDDSSVRRAYRYRIYPTARQRLAMEAQLRFACELYNAALEQRRDAWRRGRHTVTLFEQFRDLTDVRAAGIGPVAMNCTAMRDPLRRLDRAFEAFFRRLEAGVKPGYPRFRSSRRYDSLTWADGWAVRDCRELPATAVARTVTVRSVAGRWYACFSLLLPPRPRVSAGPRAAVGIDLGVQHFLTLSTGDHVAGPRAYRASVRRLRVIQRRLSRQKKGSRRQQTVGLLLARKHDRIRNLRRDHAHKLSHRLVADFALIAVEDLNFRGLASGFLAKHVSDQGWAAFLTVLKYKAAEAGTRVVRVAPAGTSQVCSPRARSRPAARAHGGFRRARARSRVDSWLARGDSGPGFQRGCSAVRPAPH